MDLSKLGLRDPAAPGTNLRLARLARRFGYALPHVAQPNQPCFHCRAENAQFYSVAMRPDFDISVLPVHLRRLFGERAFGVCRECGIAQDFNRLSPEELREYGRVLISKDMAVSEEVFHDFPVPQDYIDKFNAQYFSRRLENWRSYFGDRNFKIGKALFLRPFFGASPQFVSRYFNAQCYGIEISDVARKTVQSVMPSFKFLNGSIHAHFEGVFLESGPYDAIFDFHTLVHCIDMHDSLSKLKSLLRPGGALVMTHEVTIKPHNPFHMVFSDEDSLLKLLARHFLRVDRIDDCDIDPAWHVRLFCKKQDGPDFVAWREE